MSASSTDHRRRLPPRRNNQPRTTRTALCRGGDCGHHQDEGDGSKKKSNAVRLPVRYRKEIATILLLCAVASEFVGVSMGLPVMTSYAASFGVPEAYTGIVFSVGAFAAVLSDLWLPGISDIFGRKSVLILSLTGSAIAYICQSLSTNFDMLLASLFLGGIFGGTQPVAVAYISDIYSPLERPRYIGMVPATSAACFTIGPTLGGILANMSHSYRVPLAVAGGIVLVMLPIVIRFLPDSKVLVSDTERVEMEEKESEERARAATTSFYYGAGHATTGGGGPLLTESFLMTGDDDDNGVDDESTPLKHKKKVTFLSGTNKNSSSSSVQQESASKPPILLSDYTMKWHSYRGPYLDVKCWLTFIVSICSTTTFTAFTTAIPLILAHDDFNMASNDEAVFYTGLVVGCSAVSHFVGLTIFFNRIQRKIGLVKTIVMGTSICFVAYVVLCFSKSVAGMAVGFSMFTFGISMTRPGNFSYVTMIVPPAFTARAIAMPNIAASLGQTIAPLAATQIIGRYSYHELFLVLTLVAFVQLLTTLTFLRTDLDKYTPTEEVLPTCVEEEIELGRDEYSDKLLSHLEGVLRRRNYNLDDVNTQRIVMEMISRTFPYLRQDEVENAEDVEKLLDEYNVIPPSARSREKLGKSFAIRRDLGNRRMSVVAIDF